MVIRRSPTTWLLGHVNPYRDPFLLWWRRCAETLFMDYHNQNNVAIKIIRIFNTYGPNMNPVDGRVVSNFIVQLYKDKILPFWRWIANSFVSICRRFGRRYDSNDGFWSFFRSSEFGNKWIYDAGLAKAIDLTGSKSEMVYRPCLRTIPNNANLMIWLWEIRWLETKNQCKKVWLRLFLILSVF
jgi:hypothetical protein